MVERTHSNHPVYRKTEHTQHTIQICCAHMCFRQWNILRYSIKHVCVLHTYVVFHYYVYFHVISHTYVYFTSCIPLQSWLGDTLSIGKTRSISFLRVEREMEIMENIAIPWKIWIWSYHAIFFGSYIDIVGTKALSQVNPWLISWATMRIQYYIVREYSCYHY